MKAFHAYYYDGKNSARQTVEVRCSDSGDIRIEGESVALHCRFETLRVDPRVGNSARRIHLPGGAQLETNDNDGVDALTRCFGNNRVERWIHKLESNWRIALAALALTAAVLWACVAYGVPAAAAWAAVHMPLSMRAAIGERSLQSLDQAMMTPSKLDKARQAALERRFRQLTAPLPNSGAYRLVFRDSIELGANAFALPHGVVIVTDGLVKLADNDEQILAVLAHELGHLRYDHGLRSLLQHSLTALIAVLTIGDVSSSSSLAVTLPVVLVEAHYSRAFEWQADAFALDLLRQQAIPGARLAEILAKMQASSHDGGETNYLSGHPGIAERIVWIRGRQP